MERTLPKGFNDLYFTKANPRMMGQNRMSTHLGLESRWIMSESPVPMKQSVRP